MGKISRLLVKISTLRCRFKCMSLELVWGHKLIQNKSLSIQIRVSQPGCSVQTMKIRAGKNPTGIVVQSSGQKASWNDFQKEHFVKLLHSCASSNNQGRKRWSQETWVIIAEKMNAKFPDSNISIEQLKQLERDLKKVYKSLKEIVMQPGFEWDCNTCMLEASDDDWRKLFLRDPNTRRWHRKVLPYYADLDALYCEVPQGRAQGKNGSKDPLCLSLHVNSPCVPMGENEEATESSKLSSPQNQDDHPYFYFRKLADLCFEPTANCSPKRSRDSILIESRRNVKEDELCPEEVEPTIKKATITMYDFSIAQCLAAYHELSGFGSSDLLYIGEIFKDKQNREVFLSFRKDERAHWLSAMIATRKEDRFKHSI